MVFAKPSNMLGGDSNGIGNLFNTDEKDIERLKTLGGNLRTFSDLRRNGTKNWHHMRNYLRVGTRDPDPELHNLFFSVA